MIKRLLQMWKDVFRGRKVKYLLVNTDRTVWRVGSYEGFFEAIDFETLEEVNKYLDNDIAKSERKDWRIFKLVEEDK